MSPDYSYQETIDYLYALQKHGVKLGLSNSIALMEILGNPHRQFRAVHVAGTNGKGSTAAFLASMLTAAGYRVGLYTSPHLVSFTERIRINGAAIPEATVVQLAKRVRAGYEKRSAATGGEGITPTFFEVTTAIAFTYFAEERVDVTVVEVGMGGRLDATNVITPLVSVITNIDLEHTEFLGDTLELIALEKAGIIKPGIPVVTGAMQPEVMRVIAGEAAARQAPMLLLGRDFKPEQVVSKRVQQFDYRGIGVFLEGLEINLIGRYQVGNACLALAVVECLGSAGISVPETAARCGLKQAIWEGRLERVVRGPDIFLDGAHNPASARMLAAAVAVLKDRYRKLILVIGILGDKDFRRIISELVPLADQVIVTRPDYGRAMDLNRLAHEARILHESVDVAESVSQALGKAKEQAGPDDLILVTGSLYVVGEARAALVPSVGQVQELRGLKG